MRRKDEILESYRNSHTLREAGEKVAPSVTRQRVQQVAKEHGVDGRAKHHAEVMALFTPEMLARHTSIKMLAHAVSLSPYTVEHHLRLGGRLDEIKAKWDKARRPCGTLRSYRAGCPCELCRAANTRHTQRYQGKSARSNMRG
jgi:hypothetical protein